MGPPSLRLSGSESKTAAAVFRHVSGRSEKSRSPFRQCTRKDSSRLADLFDQRPHKTRSYLLLLLSERTGGRGRDTYAPGPPTVLLALCQRREMQGAVFGVLLYLCPSLRADSEFRSCEKVEVAVLGSPS